MSMVLGSLETQKVNMDFAFTETNGDQTTNAGIQASGGTPLNPYGRAIRGQQRDIREFFPSEIVKVSEFVDMDHSHFH